MTSVANLKPNYVTFERQSSPLERYGYCFLNGHFLKASLAVHSDEWTSFEASWNNLPADEYMADGGRYRLRRFGVFHFEPTQSSLTYMGNQAFHQEKTINTLNGGIARKFPELEHRFSTHPLLHAMIYNDLRLLPLSVTGSNLKIYVHQIRTLANPHYTGSPTPEGIHQDGHLYVAQHMIRRENVRGGESTIYDLDKEPLFRVMMTSPLDTVLVKDTGVFHSVSPIGCSNGKGYRDMLLIDFNKLVEV